MRHLLQFPLDRIHSDSRQVKPGDLFVALPGSTAHGNLYIEDALARGAAAVLSELARPARLSDSVEWVRSSQITADFAKLAHHAAGDPTQSMTLIAVTGTNGKSTVAHGLATVLNRLGKRFGLFGTVEFRFEDHIWPATHTTPDLLGFLRILRDMKQLGARGAILEISSHALDQQRLLGTRFHGAIFTNLTQDHLDYHGNMDAYYDAKARLFSEEWLGADSFSVINIDDPYGQRLAERDFPATRFTYGICPSPWDKGRLGGVTPIEKYQNSVDTSLKVTPPNPLLSQEGGILAHALRAVSVSGDLAGIRATLETPHGRYEFSSPLIGAHNLSNLLAIAAAALGMGFSMDDIVPPLGAYTGLRGRLERATPPEAPFTVFVDYAHTPDAIHQVLKSLRPLVRAPHRLWILFGCGGDRDRGKRPLMAAAAARWADALYITSDNPRSESPQAIMNDILSGVPAERRKDVSVNPDRRHAIADCLAQLRPGDVLVVAGKGHEDYQIIGSEKKYFDDVEVVQESLASIL